MNLNLNFIKNRRLEKGFSLEEMAKLFDFKDKSNYFKYENGTYRMRADMLPILAKKLDCEIKDFFYFNNC